MKLVKHHVSLPVENHDSPEEISRPKKHSELFSANSIRAILSGPSNSGKTNALMSMLLHPNGLRFENIYLWSKSQEQPKYRMLKKIIESIDGMTFTGNSNLEEVPENPLPNSIFIYDDVACVPGHMKIAQSFSFGRHLGLDCIYIGQTYTRIPKQLIRDNCNLLLLFRQDTHNMRCVYFEHVPPEVTWDQFREMCRIAWEEPFGFICIDKDGNNIRKGFDMIFK